MIFLNQPGMRGWKLDKEDVELANTLPAIIKALTPLVLGVAALAFVAVFVWKGYYGASALTVFIGLLKIIWPTK